MANPIVDFVAFMAALAPSFEKDPVRSLKKVQEWEANRRRAPPAPPSAPPPAQLVSPAPAESTPRRRPTGKVIDATYTVIDAPPPRRPAR